MGMSPPIPLSPVLIQTQEQVTKTADDNFEIHPQKAEIHSFAKKMYMFIKADEPLFIV